MAANPRLKVLPDGPYIEIDGGSLYLGRDCHLALHIPALVSKVVSKRHCRVHDDGGRWKLEDLNSTNGTWLGGRRLEAPALLAPDDVFSMGRVGPRFQWEPTGASDAGRTMLEGNASAKAERLATQDGSAEFPFRAGTQPEVTLVHERTRQQLTASGYTVVIGRDPAAAQVVIRSDEERHVSGRHAEIQFMSDGSVVLRDLKSRNGTWLNDRLLKNDAVLELGDRIVVGADPTTLRVSKLVRAT